ncbi:sugar transporter [Cutaneotrichosporon oleaginosum]|uniref:Sugar transporter n=1 Tax=Cutaneotrichosporon oleaginosum TaxID=879819 RepID=A0A0J1BDI8_9TREE|nr:sugar transporter [Cutaneotrichosporon oleaginosum]KLT46129.1 sugar transporter [Cutaneotrichosporon oleaginosum]
MVDYQDEEGRVGSYDSSPASSPKRGFFGHSRAYMMALIGFMGIFLFGYDTGLGSATMSLKSFQRDYGLVKPDGSPVDNIRTLQGNVVSILQGGAFFGALFAAPAEDRLGRKISLMIGCAIFIVGGVIQTACFSSLDQFYVGRFIAGFGVGAMSCVCPTYASEIAPKEIRGRITGLFQIVVVIGVAFAFWINYAVSFMDPNVGAMQWRIPIGFQLVPVGIMLLLLPLLRESPRWLAVKHRDDQALTNLAWIRKLPENDPSVKMEFAEITASIREAESATGGTTWREVFRKGNFNRFVIAFVIFTLQQWSGQNSISYYAPIIFESIGLRGSHTSLLTSGIYGIVKIVATAVFIFFGVERFGRKRPLLVGIFMMSGFLWIIGAIFNTNQPDKHATSPSSASIAMAAMIYLYVIPYCFSVGPLPWVICSEIFNNQTRHYGLMTASMSQWLWNFAVSMATPHMVDKLPNGGIFFFFACINIISFLLALFFLPETKGVSLEAMDIIFGLTTAEERERDVAAAAQELNGEKGDVSLHEVSIDRKERV